MIAEGILMGLSVRDFDVITLKQFRIMQKKYRNNFEYEKEVDSHVISTGLYNFHRKKGAKHEKVFVEEIKKKTIEELNSEIEDLF